MCVLQNVCECVSVCVCECASESVCATICVFVCVHVCMLQYVCVGVCGCVWLHASVNPSVFLTVCVCLYLHGVCSLVGHRAVDFVDGRCEGTQTHFLRLVDGLRARLLPLLWYLKVLVRVDQQIKRT